MIINYMDPIDPGIYGIIGSYLDYSDIYNLRESVNIKDEQTFYTSFLLNRYEEFSDRLIGNQKAYFEIMFNLQFYNYKINDRIAMYNTLKPLYDEYPKEFNIVIKYIWPSYEVVIAITDDLETIKYIWKSNEYGKKREYYELKLKNLEKEIKHEKIMYDYVYDYSWDKIYEYENIDLKYLKRIIEMMEFYGLK